MTTSGARRISRPTLVLLQLLVFLTYIFGPTSSLAEEPVADPSPTESTAPEVSPDPTLAPEPTEAPSLAPEPSADPTTAPEPTTAPPVETPAPDPSTEPTPEPSVDPAPSVAPAPGTRPYLITFVSGTTDARQLEILEAAGVTDESAIPQLSMRSVLLDETGYVDQLSALNGFAEVVRVDLDRTRAHCGADARARADDRPSGRDSVTDD